MKRIVMLLLLMMMTFVLCAEQIKIVTGEWSPYTSEQLDDKGFVSAVLKEVFKSAGYEVVIEFYPWKRCEAMILSGEAFGTFPYFFTEERGKVYSFSDPIINSESKVFYYGDKTYNLSKTDDYKPYKFGAILGYWYIDSLIKHSFKYDTTNNELSAFTMLKNGRFEMIINDELVGWDLIKREFPNEVKKFHTLPDPFSAASGLHLMISKGYPDSQKITEKFNVALKKFKESKEFQALKKKYVN